MCYTTCVMAFNSITFLFWFLPIFLIIYYISNRKFRAGLLLLASLFVCAWGSLYSLFFLVGFIFVNWGFGFLLENHKNALSLAIVCDIAFLCLFKYFDLGIALPVGISFYTFSGISYCFDVARDDVKPTKNPFKLALYLSFFPKLIMGPIVKYKDIEKTLDSFDTNPELIASGMYRFAIGLGKKMIIASSLGTMVGYCWADAPEAVASAWLGIIGFSLELYYDFSGYSDMAIGLAEIFGIKIEENFLYPYESTSLTDFWNRWHVSLGKWFKDYVYFPLGGNKLGANRTMLNLLAVWVITGLWHGTGLNFLAWGLFLFVFLCLEKLCKGFYFKLPELIRLIITDVIVMFGWVFFNSESLSESISYIGYLLGESTDLISGISAINFSNYFPLILIAIVGATSFPKTCAEQIFEKDTLVESIAKCIFMLFLLGASVYYLVSLGYTPFIYQSF